jgi:23S rRNA (cytosine1962-C5)-methyltransferase
VAVRIVPAAERALRAGHPWLFETSIRRTSRDGGPGDVAVVFDRKNRFLAVGLVDPDGPIRVRVLASGSPEEVGGGLFARRIERALSLRRSLLEDPSTTGVRVLSGENDGLPGVVGDLYGDTLVLKLYSLAWVFRLRELLPALVERLGPQSVLLLTARRVRTSERCPPAFRSPVSLHGSPAPGGVLPFLERGLRFEAHPLVGHKTGFYLDQRENRARVEDIAGGRRVLDVFGHTGAFSVAAARGGAAEVLTVDASGPALAQARRHFELNREDASVRRAGHRTLEGDAFEEMARLARERASFDLVIVDPPSFAREASQVPGALDAYRRLTELAISLLAPEGVLVQASCSARIAAEDFFAAVHRGAARSGRPIEELGRTGHPTDHPVGFPEGEYLKCFYGRVPASSPA